ncbi:MAG: M56 family metallopeptidase [Alteromonadaceae bacterium]|nr:M56 family metallopeptidase [Alteromonadaceae bacterium]
MLENITSSPFLYSLALTLIHFLWQGLVVALALKSLFIVISNKRSQLRYAFASLSMLINLLLPFITFFIIYKPDYLQLTNQLQSAHTMLPSLNITAGTSAHSSMITYLPYVSIVWFAAVLTLSVKLLMEIYNVNQLSKSSVSLADSKITARFIHLVKQINLNKTPRLLISLKTDVPMAIGWLKPVVLIPASMITGLTPTQLDMLILHELAHIRRHDYLMNFLQTLIEILLFFHPAVQWVSNQMRNEREYCSDDIAVQNCGDPLAYAHTLADTAALCRKHQKQHNHSIPNMAMAASGGDLKQRVLRLVNHHHCSISNEVSKWLASAVIILSIIVVFTQQFIKISLFDLNSSSGSFYQSTESSFHNNNNTTQYKELSQTSIARQLLAIDSGIDSDKVHEIDNIAIPQTIVNLPTTNIKSSFQPENNSEILQYKTQTTAKTPVEQPATITLATQSLLPETNNDASSRQTLEQKQTQLISSKVEKAVLTTPMAPLAKKSKTKKSISELAFERTDSTNKQSLMTNPYAKQLASLVNEPTAKLVNNSHAATNSGTLKSALSVFPQSQKFDNVVNSPITSAKETKSIKYQSPRIISSIEPKYPSYAKRKGIELDVLVHFTIDKEGLIKNIQFETKSKISYFRNTIRSAIAKWRFLPAQRNSQPVESQMSKIFSFSLK